MQRSALKRKQRMCTEFTADNRAYFFLMNNARSSLSAIDEQSWKTNVPKVPKLRTYIKYKDE